MKKHDRTKQKGDPSHETSPSLPFFEDLVRLPDHNKGIPKSVMSRERGPRFPSLFRCYSSLYESPRYSSRFSSPSLLGVVGSSLLLEDCSSVAEIVVHSSPETERPKTFCVVEMMYRLWKWPSEQSIMPVRFENPSAGFT
jgi:hypothetical protein